MLTVIKNGKFTGVRYPENRQAYRDFHAAQGELCIWIEGSIIDHFEDDGTGNHVPAYRAIDAATLLSYLKAGKKAAIHEEKKRVRDSGVSVGGTLFDSDVMARISYREFSDKVTGDPAYIQADWRASEGAFVTMDAAVFAQVEAALDQLQSDTFAWQAQQEALVDAAATESDINQISTIYPG